MKLRGCKKLEGKRIYLRELEARDATVHYRSWLKDPKVMRYIVSGKKNYSLSELRAFIKSQRESSDSLFLAILLKDTDEHIGNIKLAPVDPRHRFATIGILIGEKAHWGKGFASEAIELLSEYAFDVLKLNKIYAGMCFGNEGSLRAFQHAGYKICGIRKKHFRLGDHFISEYQVEKYNRTKTRSA